MGQELRIETFGRFGVFRDGEATCVTGRPAELLKYLALNNGCSHVEPLAEVFWPEARADAIRPRLRNVMARLNRQAPGFVERDGDALLLPPDVEVDLQRFDRLARQFAVDPAANVAAATEALVLRKGELLPCSPYAEWAITARERVRLQAVGMVFLLLQGAVARGDIVAIEGWSSHWIELDPYDDRPYELAIDALLDAGRVTRARRLAQRRQRVLGQLGAPAADIRRWDDLVDSA